MLEVAGARVPRATLVQGDALDPPFEPGSFERVHAGHFYGHLTPEQRVAFLEAAAALAGELVITDSALRPAAAESWEERVLNDGSRHRVYKRWFTAAGLAQELGGGETVHDGPWFVAVRLRRLSRRCGTSGRRRGGRGRSARAAARRRAARPATRSASAGPCLKPWPEPPPTIQVRSSSGWRAAMKLESAESS
jgi:hypothetical protein